MKEGDICRFLQQLWVLDVCYSNGAFLSEAMMDHMTQLRELIVMGEDDLWERKGFLESQHIKLRRLRVKDYDRKDLSTIPEILFLDKEELELLEFSSHHVLKSFRVESSCNSLETIVISGPTDLE